MVKQIVWTSNALQDRLLILDYWFQAIGNKKYSSYLNASFEEVAKNISLFSEIGRIYKNTQYRYVVKDKYLLVYKIEKDTIFIMAIFDARRNPKLLSQKLK